MTVAYVAQQFLMDYSTDSSVKSLVDNFSWTIIPIVNPDGYVFTWTDDRMWRKNRRKNPNSSCYGVDINRNWNYQWGTGGSSSIACSDTYMGPSGFSEPGIYFMLIQIRICIRD
jgi:murein tripeptide amidase MpaA